MVSTARKFREEQNANALLQSKIIIFYKDEKKRVDFSPLQAFNKGLFGENLPKVTEQGIESIICCHGMVAPG